MQFKIASINTLDGGVYFDQLIEFIRSENADILSLQEVCSTHKTLDKPQYSLYQYLQKNFNYKYSYFSSAFMQDFNGTYIDVGNAIISKYPIVKARTYFLRDKYKKFTENGYAFQMNTPRNLQYSKIKLGTGKVIDLFNFQGIWHTHEKDTKARINQAKFIANKISKVKLPILCADANVEIRTKAGDILQSNLLNCHPNIKHTINTRVRKTGNYSKVDFENMIVDIIFVSPKFKIISASQPDVDISDHLPLLAILEI